MAEEGRAIFRSAGCSGCHAAASSVHAPALAGVFGSQVVLADGRHITADEAYLRDSILEPRRDIVAGYAPIMPPYAGQIAEADLERILAYLMSLHAGDAE